ncbi:glycoside hydrolase family 25 protein [Butyrivibrio sp. MC2021]|uniref:glycoside hydrolase family 25 protein n=1 Tax=Butyrivibrio sp. MC2021 TaxID=1408306 RepID=UPI000684B265|nr:glycoside hydrolase family 25 protein [Butyrivibrio sp. MC2021]
MIKTMQKVLLAFSGALVIGVVIGLLFLGKDSENVDIATTEETTIFEEVTALEALDAGAIDGDTLRAEHGVVTAAEDSSEEHKDVTVNISLRSIQKDLKIKFSDNETGRLIDKVPFTVSVKSGDGTSIYDDTDRDGMIYLPAVPAGDITVFMSDITEGNVTYKAAKTQTITVAEKIEYAKIDVSDEIKTEDQVNVAEEDTKVQDEDQTTGGTPEKDESSEDSEQASEPQESYDEDISDDAEDLIAQIEDETAAAEISRQAASGTIERPTEPDQPSSEEVAAAHAGTKGIDVSKHNGNIDWGAVKASGIDFAIIRCGYRGSSSGALIVDPMYTANINGAKSAGLNVGVYFFSQAVNEAEAVEEASMVLDLISPYSLQYPVYIDVEKSNGRGDAISADERTAVTRAFLSTIQNAGYSCGVYSNKIWFENRINTGSLLDFHIWLAQYVDIPTYTATRYDMWQYTSKGQVTGIGGNVDMNVIR